MQRFFLVSLASFCVAAPFYLWVLWDLWSSTPNPLRRTSPANFYDLQAHAIVHGHLYLPEKALGVEGFLHDGHYFTYFGIFPSLLRMPILLVARGLDGKLTDFSILLAWLTTALLSALLVWRARVLLRGDGTLGWQEAFGLGLLQLAILSGSVLVYLAATPYVYNEDLAWSVALTLGCMFSLLGVVEKPTRIRIVWSAAFVLAASLNRATTGIGCIVAALLTAAWFASGRARAENRRKAIPLLAIGLGALVVACAINMAKFGIPFGFPIKDQVFSRVNAHRRYYLAQNGGKYYGLQFLPSTLLAYLRPTGIHISTAFPFITLPTAPARAVGGVVLDRVYRTASLPSSAPFLFLLACWGTVAALLRRQPYWTRVFRIPLLATALAALPVFVFPYIAPRYLADILPFVIIAAVLGAIDLWRRAEQWRRAPRALLLCVLTALAIFSVVANVGIAAGPNEKFTSTQARNYVETEESTSNLTGLSLASSVVHGGTLPYWDPAGTLFVAGRCSGLYLSNGESYATALKSQAEHRTWTPVEVANDFDHKFGVSLNEPLADLRSPVALLKIGGSSLVAKPARNDHVRIEFVDPHWPEKGRTVDVLRGVDYTLEVKVDPNLHQVSVELGRHRLVHGPISDPGPVTLTASDHGTGAAPVFSIAGESHPKKSPMPLCADLMREHASSRK